MNCEPNDLAVIVRSPVVTALLGRFVKVLHLAPSGEFRLPDGVMHSPLPNDFFPSWVCEFQNPVQAPTDAGPRLTRYAPIPDAVLRPIRPQEDDLTINKPQEVMA